jgi:hypothetical protein
MGSTTASVIAAVVMGRMPVAAPRAMARRPEAEVAAGVVMGAVSVLARPGPRRTRLPMRQRRWNESFQSGANATTGTPGNDSPRESRPTLRRSGRQPL